MEVLVSEISVLNVSAGFGVLPTLIPAERSLSVCIAMAVTFGAIWLRVRARQVNHRLQERWTERLLERQRIARGLHDTLLQGFQALVLRFEAVNQMLAEGEAKTQMQLALERMDALLVQGRDCLKDIRSSMETIANLDHHFSLIADEMAQMSNAEFRILVEGIPELLHPLVCEEVYWIGREALVNAFRHAQATEIEVELAYLKGEFRARFRDNGRGFDAEALRNGRSMGHWGLQGMYERTGKIGGRMTIRSSPSTGTQVELTVPLNVALLRHRGHS